MAAHVEEQEKWLLRADQDSEYVKTSLTEVQAEKAFRKADLTAADEKFKRAYELHLGNAAHDESGTNNAALALSSRYQCTGDLQHLTRAVTLLEKARHDAPSDAVVLQNLAHPLLHLAELDALRPWLDLPALKLSKGELERVIGWVVGEPRDAVLRSLRHSPRLQRGLALNRQARTLGPSWLDPYWTELTWISRFDDADGLAAFQEQLRSTPLIDRKVSRAAREEFLSGASDARVREATEGAIARYAKTLPHLSAANAGPSRAVVRALWADEEDSLARRELDPAHPEKALALLREAQQEWPALGLDDEIAAQLVRLALSRVVGPDDKELLLALRRDGMTVALWRWSKTPSSAVLARLKAQPELQTAAKLLDQAPSHELSALSFLLGSLTGDADLVRRSRAELAHPALLRYLEVVALIEDSDDDRAGLEMTREMIGPPT
jgi:hypothetical protein